MAESKFSSYIHFQKSMFHLLLNSGSQVQIQLQDLATIF